MTTVLVTGPIGGGKSTLCRYFADAGYPVYDCDSRCKALYDSVPGLKEKIEASLGIPFAELKRVFSEPGMLKRLEELVFPLLIEDMECWKSGLDAPVAFIESATALQKPEFKQLWDKVLMVTAPARKRHARNSEAAAREKLQSFDISLIDYTITNDSSLESLYQKANIFLQSL